MAETILVIDDQPDTLALLEVLLAGKGYSVVAALGASQGLDFAHSARPDLILLDTAHTDMDGFAVLEALRANPSLDQTPIVMLSATLRDPAMVERGLELGATEYLTKPIQLAELLVRLRSALRLAAAERELARLRRDFASMLVHDMRAPLDGVRLALGALQRGEAADSHRLPLLAQALGALGDANALIDDLLQVNRLDEEPMARAARFSIAPVVIRAVTGLMAIAEAQGLDIVVDPLEDLPPVSADVGMVRRVMDNLIGNALKFSEYGEVHIGATQAGSLLRIAVADTGPGVPLADRPHVFDRYFHVARRSATRHGGLGLGLAYCLHAVTLMGGTIGVDDRPDGLAGSVFWFTLPIER